MYSSFGTTIIVVFLYFLLGVFEGNCSTLTVGRFLDASGPLFCSFVQQLELRRFTTLGTSEPRPKQKETKPTSRNSKTYRDPPFGHLRVFHLNFFGTMRLFLKFFGLHQTAPLHLVRYFATEWILKNQKGSPFYIFRHCDSVQKSHFLIFFSKFF